MGPERCFWIRAARHGASSFDTRLGSQSGAMWNGGVPHGGVPQRARHVSIARAPKVPRYSCEGSAEDRCGRSTGGRGRSNEIEGDRTDFADLRRPSPTFALLVRPP
eukprot:615092-Prymnesium_polylepis.1